MSPRLLSNCAPTATSTTNLLNFSFKRSARGRSQQRSYFFGEYETRQSVICCCFFIDEFAASKSSYSERQRRGRPAVVGGGWQVARWTQAKQRGRGKQMTKLIRGNECWQSACVVRREHTIDHDYLHVSFANSQIGVQLPLGGRWSDRRWGNKTTEQQVSSAAALSQQGFARKPKRERTAVSLSQHCSPTATGCVRKNKMGKVARLATTDVSFVLSQLFSHFDELGHGFFFFVNTLALPHINKVLLQACVGACDETMRTNGQITALPRPQGYSLPLSD